MIHTHTLDDLWLLIKTILNDYSIRLLSSLTPITAAKTKSRDGFLIIIRIKTTIKRTKLFLIDNKQQLRNNCSV